MVNKKTVLFIVGLMLMTLNTAQAKAIEFNIEKQTLADGLNQFAKQSDMELLFSTDIVKGKKTQGLQGDYSPEAALKLILKDSDLTFNKTKSNVMIIKPIQVGLQEELEEVEDDEKELKDDENKIVIIGKRIIKRHRNNKIEPTLTYDYNYFQRFEPLSLKDMLRRVPGVSFNEFIGVTAAAESSEIVPNESQASFRGQPQSDAQILINGRRVPGMNNSNNIFLSSIPAEIIQEIQLIRSPSAELNSQGSALTINVILKAGENFGDNINANWQATYVNQGGEIGGRVSINYSEKIDNLSFNFSLSGTDENSFSKSSNLVKGDFERFDPIAFTFNRFDGTRASSRESQTNKQSKSFQGNLTYVFDNDIDLGFNGFFIDNKSSDATLFNETFTEDVTGDVLEERNDFFNFRGEGKSYRLGTTVNVPYGDENSFSAELSYDKSETDNFTGAGVVEFISPAVPRDILERDEFQLSIQNNIQWDKQKLKLGLDANNIRNDILRLQSPIIDTDQKEDYLAAFFVYEFRLLENLDMQLGSRYESRDYSSVGIVVPSPFQVPPELQGLLSSADFKSSFSGFNPSINFKLSFEDTHDFRLSIAQTIRLPNIEELTPAALISVGNDNFTFNPAIVVNASDDEIESQETIGVDFGYDYHFKDGVVGIGVFYRETDNLIAARVIGATQGARQVLAQLRPDLVDEVDQYQAILNNGVINPSTGFPYALQANDVNVFVTENIDSKSRTKGADIDFSIPMSLFNLPTMNLSGNLSYSEFDGPSFSTNGQFIFNIAFDHLIEAWDFSYGANYNQVDDVVSNLSFPGFFDNRSLNEGSKILQVFLEKRFNENLLVRLTADNVLNDRDRSIGREEVFGFPPPIVQNSLNLNEADPSFTLTFRGTF